MSTFLLIIRLLPYLLRAVIFIQKQAITWQAKMKMADLIGESVEGSVQLALKAAASVKDDPQSIASDPNNRDNA